MQERYTLGIFSSASSDVVYSVVCFLRALCLPKETKGAVLFCDDLILSRDFTQRGSDDRVFKALLPLQMFTGPVQRVLLIEDDPGKV